MTTPRIYQPIELSLEYPITLTKEASNHLMKVLRERIGNLIRIFNGQGGEFEGYIESYEKGIVKVLLKAFDANDRESPLETILAQGISRSEKMDYALQKAVELGVTRIVPLFTERGTVKWDKERIQQRMTHWQGVIIAAAEQCGRTKIPVLEQPQTLVQWVKVASAELKWICDVPNANANRMSWSESKPRSVAILIGAEGGFASIERETACAHGFQACVLGPRILRTETAPIVALTWLQMHWGDLFK